MILSHRHRDLRDDNPVVKKTKPCPVATAALGEAKSLPYKIGAAKSRVGEQAVTMNNAVVVAEQRGDNSSSYWRPRAMKAKGQPKAKLVLNVRHEGEQRAGRSVGTATTILIQFRRCTEIATTLATAIAFTVHIGEPLTGSSQLPHN